VQPNNKRAPGEAGEPDEQDIDQAAFEPGSSFSNDPSDLGDTGELPSWLRNFAGSAGDEPPTNPPATPAANQPSPSSWDKPASPRATTAQPHSDDVVDPAFDFGQVPDSAGDGFFSEDDLPEWLRALSNDSEPPTSAAPAMVSAAQPVPVTGAIQVPPVARAWVTASDMPEVSTGAHLLSSLVEVVDSRPDSVAPATSTAPRPAVAVASAPASSASASPASAPAPAPAPKPTRAESEPATVTEKPAAGSGRWNRTRLLAIAAIIVIVLFIIILLTGG
jgi:hypothetical protein